MSGCNNLDKPNLGLDSNPDQSTGSVLGELIKDLDIPAIETLIETPQNLTEDATQVQATFNLVQGVNGEQELQITHPAGTAGDGIHIDENIDFVLVDENNQQTIIPGASGSSSNATGGGTFVAPATPQALLTAATATATAASPQKEEGQEIMANITGFGNTMTVGAPALSDPNQHPRQLHQQQQQQQQMMYASNQQQQQTAAVPSNPAEIGKGAYVKILEEPAENKLRFRYECEGRSAGALQGRGSTGDTKTYPTIQIVGYQGPAVCVVSLVEHAEPYRAHPHNLVGRDGLCKKGVCSVEITKPDMTYSFQNLGIQCVRKKDAPASLDQRKEIRVDPFKKGFDHKNGSIDLNQVRLCFQVFLKSPDRRLIPLTPVVSSILKDRKAHSDLSIIEYSDDRSPVEGGKKILLFCEKISRDDIEVHFSQYTKSGEEIFAKGEFTSNDVHKQFGIALRTPPYINKDIVSAVKCGMYLYKPKAKAYSDPVDFYYVPSQMERKPPLAPPGGGVGAIAGTSVMASPSHVVKTSAKRTRAPKTNPDDESSGQVAVPNKMTTQPEMLRTGGGGVISVVPPNAAASAVQQETSIKQSNSPPVYQQQQTDMYNSPIAAAAQSPYDQQGLYQQQHQDQSPKVMGMTQDLHNLLGLGAASVQQAPPQPQAPHGGAFPNSPQPPPPLQQQQQQPSIQDYLGGNNSYVTNNTPTPLPNLSFEPGEFGGTDINNLSSNLSNHLKLENQDGAAVAGGGAGVGTAGPAMPKNNLNDPEASSSLMPAFQRQASQLDTPDVSSMSVDGGGGQQHSAAAARQQQQQQQLRNSLNKF